MASDVSCSTGLSRIWVTGNNTSQSKTAIPQCQTLHWVFHKDRCWAQYSFFCISMTCIDPQIWCVLFTLLMIQQFLHLTVTLTMSMPLLVGVDIWLKVNRLSLNISKTSYMIISNQKNTIEIRIRDSILTKVSTVKFLGVTLDENLMFKGTVRGWIFFFIIHFREKLYKQTCRSCFEKMFLFMKIFCQP